MSDDIISSYTAEDAMSDGILFDVTDLAKQVGFKITVRVTIGVKQLVTPSEEAAAHGQSYKGRLWDILNVAAVAVQLASNHKLTAFQVRFWDAPGKETTKSLWAALDYTSGRAIHIMLPEEY